MLFCIYSLYWQSYYIYSHNMRQKAQRCFQLSPIRYKHHWLSPWKNEIVILHTPLAVLLKHVMHQPATHATQEDQFLSPNSTKDLSYRGQQIISLAQGAVLACKKTDKDTKCKGSVRRYVTRNLGYFTPLMHQRAFNTLSECH